MSYITLVQCHYEDMSLTYPLYIYPILKIR